MKQKKQKKDKKQEEFKTLSMSVTAIMFIVVILTTGVLIWEMFSAQLGCAESCKSKTNVTNYNLEIKLLKEIVKNEPKNHNAWKLLGNKYCATFDNVRAKQAWAKALETAPTGESADRIRAMIAKKESMYD